MVTQRPAEYTISVPNVTSLDGGEYPLSQKHVIYLMDYPVSGFYPAREQIDLLKQRQVRFQFCEVAPCWEVTTCKI